MSKNQLSLNDLKNRRVYRLPLNSKETGLFDRELGFLASDKNIDLSLQKAKSGDYWAVALPPNVSLDDEIFEKIQAAGFQVILELNASKIEEQAEELTSWAEKGVIFNFYIGERLTLLSETFARLERKTFVYYTFICHQDIGYLSWVPELPEFVRDKLHFYFPYSFDKKDPFLSCNGIYQELRKLREKLPKQIFRPPLGHEIFDPRISEDRDLESLIEPSFVRSLPEKAVQISVVIPTYNNKAYVENTLRHLMLQDLAKENYEVILVDDGSTDGTKEAISSMVKGINFKYIEFTRPQKREMGDGQFRAGVARNLGVKWAEGEILAFLDSDILTPRNYLSDLLEKHRQHDVIQPKRIQLKEECSSRETDYTAIDENMTYEPKGAYWEKFQKRGGWNERALPWSFVSTFGLSIKTKLFKEMGWFKKTYIFYGFEDTDLGYRLFLDGHRFYLNDVNVYHLYHDDKRSEYANSQFRKRMILSRTARIFYHHFLDDEIFKAYRLQLSDGAQLRLLWREVTAARAEVEKGYFTTRGLFLYLAWWVTHPHFFFLHPFWFIRGVSIRIFWILYDWIFCRLGLGTFWFARRWLWYGSYAFAWKLIDLFWYKVGHRGLSAFRSGRGLFWKVASSVHSLALKGFWFGRKVTGDLYGGFKHILYMLSAGSKRVFAFVKNGLQIIYYKGIVRGFWKLVHFSRIGKLLRRRSSTNQ